MMNEFLSTSRVPTAKWIAALEGVGVYLLKM